MSSTRSLLRTLVILLILSSAACSEDTIEKFKGVKVQLGGLPGLKSEIDQLLPEGEAGFSVENGKVMTVTLANTPLNDRPSEERGRLATEVVAKIRDYLKEKQLFANLKTIVVEFVRYEKKFFIVDYTVTLEGFRFKATSSDSDA